jgi:hypothetical protein
MDMRTTTHPPGQREGFVKPDAEQPRRPAPAVAHTAPAPEQPEAAPAPAPPAAPTETWPVTVKLLHRAISNNKNEEIHELSFREPTGADINRAGMPVRIDQNGDILIDERKMTLMMAALSGVLTPMLDRLDPRDWASCAYRLRPFFLPEPEAW